MYIHIHIYIQVNLNPNVYIQINLYYAYKYIYIQVNLAKETLSIYTNKSIIYTYIHTCIYMSTIIGGLISLDQLIYNQAEYLLHTYIYMKERGVLCKICEVHTP